MRREFVSYPKSGRSWIRYMLVLLGLAGAVRFNHDGFDFTHGDKPPLDFDAQKRLDGYDPGDKVVYLTRDPRDVMVSLYYQVTGRFKEYFNFQGDISKFIRHWYFGAENLARFREMWRTIAAERGILVITYEECHRNPRGLLERVLNYLELPVDPAAIDKAVAASTFERMREVEESGAFAEPWLQKRNGSGKVRRGVVGGFRTELTEADIEYLNQIFADDVGQA